MASTKQLGLAGAIGGLVGVGLSLLAMRDGAPPLSPSPTGAHHAPADATGADDGKHRSLTAFDERLRRLEARPAATASGAERIVVEAASTGDLATRVEALERELGELRDRVMLLEYEPQLPEDPERAREDLERVAGALPTDHLGSMAKIPLLLRLLAGWPQHESARGWLDSLSWAYAASNQRQKALPAVERFGPRMGLAAADLDEHRLSAAWRDADVIAIATRVAASESNWQQRVWANGRLAESLEQTGQHEAAVAAIDALLAQLPAEPGNASQRRHWSSRRERLQTRR